MHECSQQRHSQSQKVETTIQLIFYQLTSGQTNVARPRCGMWFCPKKKRGADTGCRVDGPWKHETEGPGPKAGWRLGAGRGQVAASGTRAVWGPDDGVAARHQERAESHCLTHSAAVNCASSKGNLNQEWRENLSEALSRKAHQELWKLPGQRQCCEAGPASPRAGCSGPGSGPARDIATIEAAAWETRWAMWAPCLRLSCEREWSEHTGTHALLNYTNTKRSCRNAHAATHGAVRAVVFQRKNTHLSLVCWGRFQQGKLRLLGCWFTETAAVTSAESSSMNTDDLHVWTAQRGRRRC